MKLTRQFWFGILIGLSIGSALRRANAGGFSQVGIRRIYGLWAPSYKLANAYLLGQLPRMRQLAVERLRLEPGGSVLDLSCGTGANFPYLEEQIGPSGRLVGVDYTQAMLDEARRLIEQQGWQNVELVYADAATLSLKEEFDGVLWNPGRLRRSRLAGGAGTGCLPPPARRLVRYCRRPVQRALVRPAI